MFHSQSEDQKEKETRHHSLFATSQVEHAGQDKSNPGGRKASCVEKFMRKNGWLFRRAEKFRHARRISVGITHLG